MLVVGAGLAGLSTAYFLGQKKKLSVVVIEQEEALGGHSSGRNAGMLRQALPDPVLVKIAKQSLKHFNGLRSKGWADLRLKKSGSLLLAQKNKEDELRRIQRALTSNGLSFRSLSRQEAIRIVPVLASAEFSEALFCADDAMLDLTPLLTGFVKNLLKMHIPILTRRTVRGIKKTSKGFEISTSQETFLAKKIVNAAGAWASVIGKQAGAANLPLKAYRRHLFLSPQSAMRSKRCASWPFVWDVSQDFYFRPVKEGVLLSPCDKTPEQKGDRREKVNPEMKNRLLSKMHSFSEDMKSWKISNGRSGLRTMMPDGRFAIGEDRKQKGFFWVAGLGGHGVTTCFAVGELAATMVLGQKVDPSLKKALSPERFSRRLHR